MTPEDRQFWLEFRRGILQINLALERLLEVGKYEPAEKSLGPAYLNSNNRGRRDPRIPKGAEPVPYGVEDRRVPADIPTQEQWWAEPAKE